MCHSILSYCLFLITCISCLDVYAQGTPLSVALSDVGYKQIAHYHGVTVYRHKTSKTIHLGAEGRFYSPPEIVRRALLAYQRHAGNIDHVSESRVLSKGNNWLLVYQRLNLPMISDRDFVLRVKWGQVGQILWTSFRAVTGKGPGIRKGIVRMVHHQGKWQLKPINNGRATLARYQVSLDLGGWLPRWMARSNSGKEIPQMFGAIGKLVRLVAASR